MRTAKTIGLMIMLISFINGQAQRKQNESEQIFQELANIRGTFKKLPVRMNIELENAVDPESSVTDTMSSQMTVFIAKNEFYMEAEGLEQIITDSLQVMVNHQTMQIRLRKPTQLPGSNVATSFFSSMPEASYAQFNRKYTAQLAEDGDIKTINLQSRDLVNGTIWPAEAITIDYNRSTHDPVSIASKRVRLVLTDSVSYSKFENSPAYKGKTMKVESKKGTLFFIVKTQTLTYTFNRIVHDPNATAVRMGDRIVATRNGEYLPATGFEQYAIYKEF